MKHLKLYEKYKKITPDIGDYVVIQHNGNNLDEEVVYYVNNNVGEIVGKEKIVNIWYKIKYNPVILFMWNFKIILLNFLLILLQ